MSSSSPCTRNETALTSECNSLCPQGRPCIAYAAGDESECSSVDSTFGNCTADDYCTYQCFATGPDDFAANGAIDFSTYTFLVPFGSTVAPSDQELSWSSEEEAAVTTQLTAMANLTAEYPSKSNDVLQHVEPLDFMASTTRVVLAGGSNLFGVRGKVAHVQLPEELFAADTQLQAVTLANLGLEQVLASSLPAGLANLTITNCLLTSYPEDLQTMDALENLDLSKNYFGYFPVELDLPKLQTLNLSTNSLARFESSLPSLVTLDISNNNLTSIPTSIFNMTALHRLDLRENYIASVMLTSSQFSFLQGIDDLNVDSFGEVACNSTQKLQTSNSIITVLTSEHRPRGPDHDHRVTFLTKFRGSRLLICKRLQQEAVDEAIEMERFVEEVQISASLDHPRIVALVGVLWSRVYGLEALYEYMEGGNLRSYLAEVENSKELCSWRSHSAWKLQVAFDMAEALAVLLSSPPELRARLDDFVAEQQDSAGMSTVRLSLREERWLPPEVITGTADYSPAADMYAFGVILSEIDTHSLPYENIQGVVSGRQSMSDVEILDLVASGKLHPVFTLGCPTGVRELAERCLSFEASDRPTALQTVIVLRTLLAEDRRVSYTL
uniref:Protein kinase domain-containing protein n=1 Tax=Phytophthora ramorum TaxID=164328 RepID=H3HBL8_PHYRM